MLTLNAGLESRSRPGRLDDDRVLTPETPGVEGAELIPAEAVGATPAPDDRLQLAAEPCEQRVAGGMTEGVVVALESVQVEEDERVRLAVGDGDLEIGEQLAAVAQAAEWVGEQVIGGLPKDSHVLAVG